MPIASRMSGDRFLVVTPVCLDHVGQQRHGQADAVLHQHLGQVQVDAVLEGDRQGVGAVVGALRRHVHHVLDAVDLLLDRRGDRLGDHLRAGAGVLARRPARWAARSAGYCAIGSVNEREPPGQRDHDRQHRGEDRPVDEEAGEHGAGSPRVPWMTRDHLPGRSGSRPCGRRPWRRGQGHPARRPSAPARRSGPLAGVGRGRRGGAHGPGPVPGRAACTAALMVESASRDRTAWP